MDIDELFSLLDSRTIQIENQANQGMKRTLFTGAVLIANDVRRAIVDVDAVYCCTASFFNSLADELIAGRAFFLLRDAPLKPHPTNSIVVMFNDREEWSAGFERISSEFRSLQRCKEKMLELTALVNRNASLQTLVDAAADIVGAPASVLDNSLSFLATSRDFNDEIVLNENRISGMIPDDALPLMKAKGLVNPKKPFDLMSFEWEKFGVVRTNYFSLIHSRDTIIGSISFFSEGEKLRRSRVDMIPTIAQILSIHMQRNNAFMLNKNLYYAHLFKQLEEGTWAQNPEQTRQRFSLFGYNLKKYLHVFLVDISREYMPAEQAQPLAERMHPHIYNSIYTLGQSSITFISSSDSIIEEGACDVEALNSDLQGTSIVVGVSSVFVNPERMPYQIQEAQRAIKLGRRLEEGRHVVPFSEYRLLDLASNVTDNKKLYSYRFPPLVHVIDTDIENDTYLTYTLYKYLQDPTHPQAVADELFIHKNTLYYRLEKIRDIMGCDFKDAETITNIQMTFHVLRLQNRFEQLVSRTEPRRKLV